MRIVITDCDHDDVDAERRAAADAGVDLRLEQCRTEDDVVARCADADGLLVQYAPITERVLRATAGAFVISPSAWAVVAPDPDREPDKLSAQWLLALAARLLRDVGRLITAAGRRRIATFAVDGEIRFASAEDRAAFARELGDAVGELVARYHRADSPEGRPHRLVVALHPAPPPEESP